MRDNFYINRRRNFINNADEYISSNNEHYEYTTYRELQARACPSCNLMLHYNSNTNHLVCECGYIFDLNVSGEQEDDEDFGGASSAHSNNRKKPFAAENGGTAIVPMAERRTGIHDKPDWWKDKDMRRLSNRGYNIIDYREITPTNDKMLQQPGRDNNSSDWQRQQNNQGRVLSTDSGLFAGDKSKDRPRLQ